ncbi:MAG: TolC family protein [Cytophagales bacterium]|nr:TolC family protein [Cytophagales bacterium]
MITKQTSSFNLIKISYFRKAIAIVAFIMVFSMGTHGQNLISVDQAIDLSLTKNPQMKLADQKIDIQKALLPSSINLNNIELVFQSPDGVGLRPTLYHIIDFPTIYAAQYAAQKSQVKISEADKKVTTNQIKYSVRTAYLTLQYNISRREILRRYDSILSDLLDVNNLRYGVGQISKLEKVNGEAKYYLIQNQLLQNLVELKNSRLLLSFLFGAPGDTTFMPADRFSKNLYNINENLIDTSMSANPLTEYYKQQFNYNKKQLRVETNRMLPGIVWGFFNQASPIHETPLAMQFMWGVNVPLAFWSYGAKIKGAQKGVEAAQTLISVNKNKLSAEYSQAISQYAQYEQSLNYFETIGLEQSKEIIKSARQSFKSGAIGYYFYLQNLDQAFQIELNYLEVLKNYNQSIINLRYIKGEL